ncbi:MAG: hypothetical protein NUV65_01995 [Candidatus Roizmanbacteria bacterium]|nr:hypothetical protein [Candidatus Roizmanbacteria bacterium]
MYSTIIPELVSIDTNTTKIPGFYLSEKLHFYPQSKKKSRFHYTIKQDNSIIIPQTFDTRSGYYLSHNNSWYYERRTPFGTLKFHYNTDKKEFYFNKLYSFIPIEIGNIFPAGRHIANLIGLELFLSGFIIIRACAFSKDGITYLLIAPGLNGKTSIVNAAIQNNGNYVAEDLAVFDFSHKCIYPTSPKTNFGRTINDSLLKTLDVNQTTQIKSKANTIIFYQKSHTEVANTKTFLDYVFMNSLLFLSNPFIRSYIAENSLSNKVLSSMQKIQKTDLQSVSISSSIFELNND